jgi:hypothetical protein
MIKNYGLKLGVLQSPPLIFTLLGAILLHHMNKIFKIFKMMWVFYPQYILMLPGSILRSVLDPLDLYNPYGSIPELFG